ncbi:MAG TPA: YtxH domain-containing protein [Candidatus Acidoferrales bacterium]|jgi:gas vesicle protein|nr:YtxH domain-containing protein [Candidatus Acidoferrales bacterium]
MMSVQSKVGLFAFGMIAGATLGLLFAPEAGEEMRENLSTAVRKGVERATEQGSKWVQRAQDVASDAQNRASDYMEQARDVLDRAKGALS